MNDIDLTKILKNCPKGTKFYSTIFGEVEFSGFCEDEGYAIIIKRNYDIAYITKDGRYLNRFNGECTLFPSKDQRDWSKFSAPWYKQDDERLRKTTIAFLKDFAEQGYENAVECIDWLKSKGEQILSPKFKVGDKIVNSSRKYMRDSSSQGIISKITDDKYIFTDGSYIFISEQDRWELAQDKFDPKTLQPFDKILVRDYSHDEWMCSFFSHMQQKRDYPYICINIEWRFCIPYNDETKHLVGTSDEAPEFYRYWED